MYCDLRLGGGFALFEIFLIIAAVAVDDDDDDWVLRQCPHRLSGLVNLLSAGAIP